MAKKKKAIIMGLDTAAVNSGVCIIEAKPLKKDPHVSCEVFFESGFVHGPKNEYSERAKFADIVKGLALSHKVDFVSIEDYAARIGPTNTSAYQHGETVGMVKKALWEANIPLMLVGPTPMRSFMSVPTRLPDSGKQFIMDWAKENYGFESAMTNQNKRSNATDAFIHCLIASMAYFHLSGEDMGEFSKAKADVLFGDGKKMAGITKMPHIFYGCSWAPEALE